MRAKEFTNFTYKTEPYEGWNGDGIVVRAYDGGNEVGHVIFEPTEDDNTQWYAVDVEVEEPYQRKGIATKMYDIAKKSAKQQGAIIVKSHTQTDAGRGLWQDKQVWEQINESKTTLNNMYGGHFPDRDEEFWDYVTPRELGQALTVETMQKHKVLIMLLSQYRAEHIDDITDMLDDDQQEIVQSYVNDPALSSKIVVVANNRIIDGNHRALAAAIKGVPINYVDLAELDEEPIDEEINPDCFNPAFNDTQEFDGLTYRATVEEEYGKPILVIKVLDDFQPVGLAKFKQSKDSVVSLISSFRPEYQGKGIARNVYAYVRMLGNTIQPSKNQLPPGKAMWKSWKKSGDAKHLMKENVIGKLHIDPLTIEIDQHAIDRAGDRNIRPEFIDQILRKLPKLVHIMANVKVNKFWVFDPKLNIKIGLAKSDTPNLYRLNTVVKNPTYDSDVPTITLK